MTSFSTQTQEPWWALENIESSFRAIKNGGALAISDQKEWSFGIKTRVLLLAAENGDMGVLRELRKGWDDKEAEFAARNFNNGALRRAAENGHVEVLRELREGWYLTSKDARINNNEALRMAARNGHVAVLRELRQEWGLTAEDARANDNEVFRMAARDGYTKVFRELRKWNLTTDDVHAMLVMAVKEIRHAALIEELMDRMELDG